MRKDCIEIVDNFIDHHPQLSIMDSITLDTVTDAVIDFYIYLENKKLLKE